MPPSCALFGGFAIGGRLRCYGNITRMRNVSEYMLVLALCLVDSIVVLRPTQHKIGHFGDIPQANLLDWHGKTKPNTRKAHIHQSKEIYNNT